MSVAVREQLAQQILTIVEAALAEVPEPVSETTWSQVEGAMEQATRQIGRLGLALVLGSVGQPTAGVTQPCPCGGTQTTDHYATARRQTVLGEVTIRRAAYRCLACGSHTCPWDAQIGVPKTFVSARLHARLSLFCAAAPFAEATRWLAEASGVTVSAKYAQVVSEALGHQVDAVQSGTGGAPVPPTATPTATGKRLYLGLDGVLYCTTETDAVGQRCWREAKVAVSFTPKPAGRPGKRKRRRQPPNSRLVADGPPIDAADPDRQRYVAQLGAWPDFAAKVWHEAVRQGVEHAEELIILSDGAVWIQSLVDELFAALPLRLTRILDIRHAEQHLWAVGRTCLGDHVLPWIQAPLAQLRHGQVDALLATLRTLPAPTTEAAHVIETTAAYFAARRDQLQYPSFRARGLQIGSGLAESGCKRLITQRLCGAGMQWTVPGAQAITALRAAYLSGRWAEVEALAGVA